MGDMEKLEWCGVMLEEKPEAWALSFTAILPPSRLWTCPGWQLNGPEDIKLPFFLRSIRKSSETYLHVAVSSLVFGFTDDLEVLLDQQGGAVELRSESRLGESDFGVNRNRLKQLRSDVDRRLDAG